VHQLVYTAPLDLRKSFNAQDELKKAYIYQEVSVTTLVSFPVRANTHTQMNRLFARTRLARCADNWATKAMVIQFLAGHRRRMAKLEKDSKHDLARIVDEDEMDMMFLAEGMEFAPEPTAGAVAEDDGEWEDYDDLNAEQSNFDDAELNNDEAADDGLGLNLYA
jgi:hypothetical protein